MINSNDTPLNVIIINYYNDTRRISCITRFVSQQLIVTSKAAVEYYNIWRSKFILFYVWWTGLKLVNIYTRHPLDCCCISFRFLHSATFNFQFSIFSSAPMYS